MTCLLGRQLYTRHVTINARLLPLVPFVLVVPLAASSEWPQWRGPSSAGVSLESALPATWSATENIAWKVRLEGMGTSSPIVSGDIVFVTSQVGRSSVAEGDSHPQLARDDGELAKREAPIGGRPRQDLTTIAHSQVHTRAAATSHPEPGYPLVRTRPRSAARC